jgi:hypothetical protein
LKSLFDKVDESQVVQLEKELSSLDPHSFERIEDYLACVKDQQLKLDECGKNYQKKYGKHIELVQMNLRTPFDLFCSTLSTNWQAHKEDGKGYIFDTFCGLLINDQHRLLNEGEFASKHQAHFLKGKGKINYKERGHFDAPVHRQECLDQKTKEKIDESTSTWKN